MSKTGKLLFLLAGMGILSAGLSRLLLGQGHAAVLIGVSVAFIAIVASFVCDIGFYKEFFMMRTTKHGMNMGVLIILFVMTLVAVNFMAFRHNVKWDLTEEGLNSISDQSKKMLAQIQKPMQIRFFYRPGTQGIEQVQQRFKEMVDLFRDENSRVSIEFVDSLKRPGLAKDYNVDRATAMVFVDYDGKRNTVDPLTEEGLATAMLKATRERNKVIYFISGHGEKKIEESGPAGLTELSDALVASGYDVESLNLLDKARIPENADAVMIMGPQTAYLDTELKALRDYAREGGKVFIAIDPGMRHNLANLTKTFGIEFKNDYVLDQFGQILGASAAMALGRNYGTTDITQNFTGQMTMFYLASRITKAAESTFAVDEIVKTGETSFSTNEISNGQVEVQTDKRGPHTIGLVATGKLPADGAAVDSMGADSSGKEFSAVVFGDSDFLSNQFFFQQLNRDLALNSVAYLLKENNLISIRPKQPKGTMLSLSQRAFWTYVFVVIIPVPILLFGIGGYAWHRRRSA